MMIEYSKNQNLDAMFSRDAPTQNDSMLLCIHDFKVPTHILLNISLT